MSSKREEEKNEKIIRGLMKLPPNRRCINCNSLGPQYVCTNFWTFICTACSGIHREFTHRVKSVSMAKFSAQEVDALQRGGNQRAREIYLKEWDAQRQFLPSSSNVERIREFIKSVYVDKKYTGARTSDKPPRDTSGRKHNDEEGRRASSYHSYSQSPPYDHQYEERRYGKPAAMLTRPGSERLHYEGKLSSFFYSPGRLSDQVLYEDRFANEGSGMKVLEHSVSGGSDRSDHLRYDAQSPNFRKDVGYGSPTGQPTRDMVAYEMQMQRTSSTGSSVFSDSHSTSFNTMSSTDVSVENQVQHGQLQEAHPALVTGRDSTPFSPPIDLFANFNQQQPPPTSAPALGSNLVSHSLSSASTQSVDLFAVASQQHLPSTSATVGLFSKELPLTYNPPVDLFANANQQLPHPSTAVDLFSNSSQQNIPSTSSVDLFAVTNKQVMVSTIPKDFVANFDQQQVYSVPSRQELPSNNFTQSDGWATFDSPTQSISRPAAADVYQTQPSIAGTSTWCDFGNNMQISYANITQQAEPRGSTENFITSSNQMWEASGNAAPQNFVNAVPQATVADDKVALAGLPAGSVAVDFSLPPQVAPAFVGGVQSDVQIQKSTNPFDLPYEADVGTSKMFLDMSSLQAALPSSQLPNAFMGGLNPAWFPSTPVPSYIPTVAQGSLIYMGGQAPPPQHSNVNSQGPVASLGNPFA